MFLLIGLLVAFLNGGTSFDLAPLSDGCDFTGGDPCMVAVIVDFTSLQGTGSVIVYLDGTTEVSLP